MWKKGHHKTTLRETPLRLPYTTQKGFVEETLKRVVVVKTPPLFFKTTFNNIKSSSFKSSSSVKIAVRRKA